MAGVISADASFALELRGAVKQYGQTYALRGVDLQVSAGEFLTLLGPSGSGKTTALMLWAGFVEPTSGSVIIGGRDMTSVPAHRRGLGMVFQHYALFPHMNVSQNIAFPLLMARWDRARSEARVGELLDLVGLRGLGSRAPRQLSGGQQQRVALARALAAKSPVVLMDEPLGALDRQLREEMQEEFRRIHRETGTTFVYVTHDQTEALSLSDRIAVMRDGRVEQIGAPEELYERPKTAFVAEFFGEATLVQRDTALYAVRPERVRVIATEATATGMTTLAGTIVDRSYGGAVVRIRIDSPEAGRRILATVPAYEAETLAPGQAIRVAWRHEDEKAVES